jgi:hypothetical protein
MVDLVIVAGEMSTESIRSLCASQEIDVVLNINSSFTDLWKTPSVYQGIVLCADSQGAMAVNVLQLHLQGSAFPRVKAVEYGYVRLASDVPEAQDIRVLLDKYYEEMGKTAEREGLRGPLAWDALGKGAYVGSSACRDCHSAEYNDWINSPHADAMSTLRKIHRDSVPLCVQCHVVGWGTATGYRMDARRREMEGVGCEVCHGAGQAHAVAPREKSLRRMPEAQVCSSCHDDKHAPGFMSDLHNRLKLVDHGR